MNDLFIAEKLIFQMAMGGIVIGGFFVIVGVMLGAWLKRKDT